LFSVKEHVVGLVPLRGGLFFMVGNFRQNSYFR
jgi:hypothetical protein